MGVRNIAEGERGCIEYPHFVSFVLAGIVGTTVQVIFSMGENTAATERMLSQEVIFHILPYIGSKIASVGWGRGCILCVCHSRNIFYLYTRCKILIF